MNRHELAIELAYQAGKEVLKYFGKVKQWKKKDNSPLSEADLVANDIICQGIKKYFPQDAILSEENEDCDYRLDKKIVWFIDPIDGTANFIRQENDFCTMIGIVKEGKADFGVVYLPIENQLFVGGTTFPPKLIINKKETLLKLPYHQGNIVMKSKDYFDKHLNTLYTDNQLDAVAYGSAGVKVCKLILNIGQHYFHTSNVGEWDTAAPEAIYKSLGGSFLNRFGKENVYNKKKPIIEGIIVTENKKIRQNAINFLKKIER